MYVVIDKKTKEIIHKNHAPLTQNLTDKEVYYYFDHKTMEIGKIDGALPEHFRINENKEIVELTLQEKVESGIIKLKPEEKIVENKIVEKTVSEKVADGLITLQPTQKIVGEGINEQIVEKSLSEQVAEGLITLQSTQKIVGEGKDEEIVEKSLSEQITEGIIKLDPSQKLLDGQIVDKTKQELLDEGIISMEDIKEENIQRLRGEVEEYFSSHKTPNGFRLDQLARQKANFSFQFRNLLNTDENKQRMLNEKIIYPDNILDEIMEEIRRVQTTYDKAKKGIYTAYEKKKNISAFEAISISKYLAKEK